MTARPRWEASVRVDAPLANVWDVVDDLSLIPDYHPEVRNVELLSGSARRKPGVRYKCMIPDGPRKGWCVEQVVEHEALERTTVSVPDDSWGMCRKLEGFLVEISIRPEDGNATLLRLRAWYRPRGLVMRVLDPVLMRRVMRRRAAETLEGVKRLVERRLAHDTTAELAKKPV